MFSHSLQSYCDLVSFHLVYLLPEYFRHLASPLSLGNTEGVQLLLFLSLFLNNINAHMM